jgi:two-component system OmpR family sensor kinase
VHDHWFVQALRRLPIRVRLTLFFAAVMVVVLTATGAFVYLRMKADLGATVNTGLRSRAADVVAMVQGSDRRLTLSGRSPLTEAGENLAQVLGADGTVLDSTPSYRSRPLLTPAELARALRKTTYLERPHVAGLDAPVRFIATPATHGNVRTVAVVGALLDDRNEALSRLLVLLAIGGPVALVLASLACYAVTAAALRPVESMRSEAAEVSMHAPGRRLPVPPAHDEISRLGTTLNDMLARQELAFERERNFVSDASHELRSPLAILRSEVELALQQGRSEEELRAALQSVAEETDRLTQLAEDLLVLARSDDGRLGLAVDDVPVAELLQTADRRFGDRARASGREVRIDADGALLVGVDRPRIDQALANLVENALRYGQGDIVLRAVRSGDAVELHVRDDGRGFPDEFIARAFERFTRADHARSRGGAGLGLAIVAAIADAHGGSAGARNVPGGGADVWITLPVGCSV